MTFPLFSSFSSFRCAAPPERPHPGTPGRKLELGCQGRNSWRPLSRAARRRFIPLREWIKSLRTLVNWGFIAANRNSDEEDRDGCRRTSLDPARSEREEEGSRPASPQSKTGLQAPHSFAPPAFFSFSLARERTSVTFPLRHAPMIHGL